jgi:transposase InsO family protein
VAHRRAKLTVAGRRLLVERVVEQGWPPVRAAEAQGVSLATVYKWLRRWRAEGLAGLADRSCRPHSSPRRLSNGKVERFNLTLAGEWAYARPYPSNQRRLDALPAWLHDYNHHRPHRALDGRSPMQLLNNLPGSHT